MEKKSVASNPFQIGYFYHVNNDVVRITAVNQSSIESINDVTGECQLFDSEVISSPFVPSVPEHSLRGLEATRLLMAALAAGQLPRTSTLNGGDNCGWLPRNHIESSGFSIRKSNEDSATLIWTLTVSGRPHLDYQENEDGSHDPINPQRLFERVKEAAHSIGLSVLSIKILSYQRMWDDDVSFEIRTPSPSWLLSDN